MICFLSKKVLSMADGQRPLPTTISVTAQTKCPNTELRKNTNTQIHKYANTQANTAAHNSMWKYCCFFNGGPKGKGVFYIVQIVLMIFFLAHESRTEVVVCVTSPAIYLVLSHKKTENFVNKEEWDRKVLVQYNHQKETNFCLLGIPIVMHLICIPKLEILAHHWIGETPICIFTRKQFLESPKV